MINGQNARFIRISTESGNQSLQKRFWVPPIFTMKKRSKRRKILDILTPQSTTIPQQEKSGFDEDQDLEFDLKTVELERIGPRLTRYLAGHQLSSFMDDVASLLASKKIEMRRNEKLFFRRECSDRMQPRTRAFVQSKGVRTCIRCSSVAPFGC